MLADFPTPLITSRGPGHIPLTVTESVLKIQKQNRSKETNNEALDIAKRWDHISLEISGTGVNHYQGTIKKVT